MSRQCELLGTKPLYGNTVSHSNRKARRRWLPNLKEKKYFVPELGQTVTLKLSTRAIRTIDKQGGISNAIRKAKTESLSERLQRMRRAVVKAMS
jgi:large subunit ribosomal protein L28